MVGVGTKQIKEECLLGLMICAILTVKKQKAIGHAGHEDNPGY